MYNLIQNRTYKSVVEFYSKQGMHFPLRQQQTFRQLHDEGFIHGNVKQNGGFEAYTKVYARQ